MTDYKDNPQQAMEEIAEVINRSVNSDPAVPFGFVLLVVPFGGTGHTTSNYASNLEQESVIKAMAALAGAMVRNETSYEIRESQHHATRH